MALACVTGITIHSLYPETGGVASRMYAVKLFNAMIEPRNNPAVAHSHIHLLWSHLAGTLKDVNPLFQPNHIVPLFLSTVFHQILTKIPPMKKERSQILLMQSKVLKMSRLSFLHLQCLLA